MNEEEKNKEKPKEKIVEENRDFLEVLIDNITHKIMGRALDLARISEMTDRALKQYERSLKDYTNELLTYCMKTLREKGFIK